MAGFRAGVGLGLGLALFPCVALQAAIPETTQAARAIALPPAPPPLGLPQLQARVSCPALQNRLRQVLGSEASVWSVSVADESGRLLADLNGLTPRIPASNQKLVATAIALDRLGPDYSLTTRLWRQSDGSLLITGEGDPDFNTPQLQRFAKLAMGQGGSGSPAPSAVRIQLEEEPPQRWWPAGWPGEDRVEAYGAPITRLAVTSNAKAMAVSDPPSRLQQLLGAEIQRQGGQAVITTVSPTRSGDPSSGAVLLHEERSIGMHGLLSLANTESHNFTAEVLLRQGTGSWDQATSQALASRWLAAQGLPMAGVKVVDGSGLDRGNRLTSRLLVALMLRMAQHPMADHYFASMAIAGERGTLRNYWYDTELQGQFFGKTGTIRGVRSVSGLLDTSSGPRYISMISNGSAAPNSVMGQLLRQTRNGALCP